MTLVHNTTPYESKSKDEKVFMHNRISLKSVPLFYLAHTLGTKKKWVKDMIKEFLCHKSANKFDIHETGNYIDKFINAENAQYVMVYHIPITDPPSSSESDGSNRSSEENITGYHFIHKYKLEPVFVAVFSVNKFGGLLDFMATSPKYRRYGLATHMIYVIQAIVYEMEKHTTIFLNCDSNLKDTYTNMGFHLDDNCDKTILEYFELNANFKNTSKHMVFKISSLIETKLVLYEMRNCYQFTDEEFIISSKTHVNAISDFIKNENYSPLQNNDIKEWHISAVLTEKGHNTEEKCKQVLKKIFTVVTTLGNRSKRAVKLSLYLNNNKNITTYLKTVHYCIYWTVLKYTSDTPINQYIL